MPPPLHRCEQNKEISIQSWITVDILTKEPLEVEQQDTWSEYCYLHQFWRTKSYGLQRREPLSRYSDQIQSIRASYGHVRNSLYYTLRSAAHVRPCFPRPSQGDKHFVPWILRNVKASTSAYQLSTLPTRGSNFRAPDIFQYDNTLP